jgi:hypothetical protein
MKNKMIYACAIVLALFTITSCGDSGKNEKINSQLLHENDSLKKILNPKSYPNDKSLFSAPVPDIASMNNLTNSFTNLPPNADIHIPISWLFDKEHMQRIINNTDSCVKFYAGVNDMGSLVILAVPTMADGFDKVFDEEDKSLVYDFSDFCPSNCSNSNLRNGTDNPLIPDDASKIKTYRFIRQSANKRNENN